MMPAAPERSARAALAVLALVLAGGAPAQDVEDARSLARAGRHDEAERAARSFLEKREREAGPEARETADALDLLVEILYGAGKGASDEARLLAGRAVRARDAEDAPDDAKLPSSLGNLASCLWAAGEYAEARPLLERSIAIREKSLGPSSVKLAVPLNNLGHLFLDSGEPTEARRAFERAMALDGGGRPPDGVLAAVLHGLGLALVETGDLAEARARIEESLRKKEASGGSGAASATYRVSLALVLEELELLDEGSGHLRAVIDDLEGAAGKERVLATALNNLAWLEHERGRHDDARALYSRALGIREKVLGPDHPHVAWTLRNLGLLLLERGELDQAEGLIERSLSIRERSLGPGHPLLGDSLLLLARLRFAKGDLAKALEDSLRAENLRCEHARLTARYLSERQAIRHAGGGGPLRHASRSGSALDIALACAVKSAEGDPVSRAWDALVRSRAPVLDELASRRRARASGDAEIARSFEALHAAREKLARLFVEDASAGGAAVRRERLERAIREREDAERALGERSAAFRAEWKLSKSGYDEAAASLPARAALVGFARFLIPSAAGRPEAVYAAFVRAPGAPGPSAAVLGPAAEIDALAVSWREALSRGKEGIPAADSERESREIGARLRRLVWDPVVRRIAAADAVFVAAAGELHLAPLGALPDGDGYLVESGPAIHYLSSERDLAAEHGPGTGSGGTLLAIGDPDFSGAGPSALPAPGNAKGAGLPRESIAGIRDLGSVRFEALPASAEEAREAVSVWKAAPGGGEAVLLTGPAATESSFKALAPGKAAIHLATHGFFLGSAPGARAPGARGIGKLAPSGGPAHRALDENPLLLSGIAFAGANRRGAGATEEDDGILTAEEIAGLDLSSVQWAVLSACETGAGKLDAGEGVLGLRRAFQAAGVRTVVTSLWSAEDRAAREWMGELYRARLHEGLGAAEAVRKAGRRVLALRRASGRSTHPFYWAGFVAAGDWR